jgi:hypothetical protein
MEKVTANIEIDTPKKRGPPGPSDLILSVEFVWKNTLKITLRALIPVDIASAGSVSGTTSDSNWVKTGFPFYVRCV